MSSSSEVSRESRDKRCPHAQFHADRSLIGLRRPLSIYLSSAPECAECDLLLRVIEEFKPGWIDEHKNGRGWIRLNHQRPGNPMDTSVPALIDLSHGSPDNGGGWPRVTELGDSFQFFRRSRGTFGYSGLTWSMLCCTVAFCKLMLTLCLFT